MSIESKAESWGLSWVVVTGASQGLGASICQGLAGRLAAGSRILGLARSAQGLQDTAEKVQRINPDIKFIPHVMDLETASREDLKKVIGGSLKAEDDSLPSRSVIFHNAASIGTLDYLRDYKDEDNVKRYFQLNVSSVVVVNAVFLEIMSQHPGIAVEVINISSLCGVQPFKSWGLYCAGKAARDMIFRVLAEEEPNILVLNYAPGPLDNNMQEIARSLTADKEVRSAFASLKDEGKLIPCDVTVKKLLDLLRGHQFKSGDHVDYYDV